MKRTSKDGVKFESLHSTEHNLLIMLINHARIQKGCLLVENERTELRKNIEILPSWGCFQITCIYRWGGILLGTLLGATGEVTSSWIMYSKNFHFSSMKRRNKAFVKLYSLYPNDKIRLVDLINHARSQKVCPLVIRKEQENMSTELIIVRKNRNRVKFIDDERLRLNKRKRMI